MSPENKYPFYEHLRNEFTAKNGDTLTGVRDIFTDLSVEFAAHMLTVPPSENPETKRTLNVEILNYPKSEFIETGRLAGLLRSVDATTLPTVDRYAQAISHINQRPFLGLITYTPIGEYGEDISIAATRATHVVARNFYQKINEKCIEFDSDFPKILNRNTVFFPESVKTSIEGVRTISETLCMLSTQRVPGFEKNPIDLFKTIVKSNILNELAINTPIAIINPMCMRGVYFAQPLESDGQGGVRLTASIKGLLRNEKALAEEDPKLKHDNRTATNRGCPVALKGAKTSLGKSTESGIRIMADVLMPYIEYFYNQSKG